MIKAPPIAKEEIVPGFLLIEHESNTIWLCLSVTIDNRNPYCDLYVIQYMTVKSSYDDMFSLHKATCKFSSEKQFMSLSQTMTVIN